MPTKLPQSFYARPTLDVADGLLGKVLVHVGPGGVTSGVIVEVEAYVGEADPACHAAAGLTARNVPLYGPPGHAYVYLNYGMHYLMNAVTEPVGMPAAVLIRALAPRDGVDLMRRRRASTRRRSAPVASSELGRGPGNLTRALGITGRQNRLDLCGDRLFIEDRRVVIAAPLWSRRIGISVGTEVRWRGYVPGCEAVSGGRASGR